MVYAICGKYVFSQAENQQFDIYRARLCRGHSQKDVYCGCITMVRTMDNIINWIRTHNNNIVKVFTLLLNRHYKVLMLLEKLHEEDKCSQIDE